jgi:hypothetical protein
MPDFYSIAVQAFHCRWLMDVQGAHLPATHVSQDDQIADPLRLWHKFPSYALRIPW